MNQSSINRKSSVFGLQSLPAKCKSLAIPHSAFSTPRSQGFTLIELMIVVIIMAALAGMVLPRLLDRADDAKMGIAAADIASITSALKFYKLDVGQFPKTDEGLSALMVRSSSAGDTWKGPYLEREPKDPWGRLYQYQVDPGSLMGFRLWSTGPDEASSEDDINNWDDR